MPTTEQLSNRAKWLDGLRSRKYRQGTGALVTKYGEYCCLGVAAKVCNLELDDTGFWIENVNGDRYNVNDLLPVETFSDLFGVDEGSAGVMIERGVNMNDNERASFRHIAGFMEKWFTEADDAAR